MSKKIYNSDKPIFDKTQDKFSRSKFAYRIAETIINRDEKEGLVLGLYGAWGEGKTSVLNLIESPLKEKDEILIIKFNPWRFSDEESLIINFFKNISDALNKELYNRKEKVGDFLSKYGSIGNIINLDLSKVGISLSDSELKQLKDRVNGFLEESNKKAVVIIDDIDRLDKDELFALFKLIKLIGDFSNTYYILSFDDEMVASSIGERYGAGNKLSGDSFLEKIIQVPLRIPQALSQDLLNFTYTQIDSILEINKITLEKKETANIAHKISQYILPKIKTPRLAIRFANSLSFLIPLLKGEINTGDLILFEAVKLFYPDYYIFIKSQPSYFTNSYINKYSGKKDTKKTDSFKDKISKIKEDKDNNTIIPLIKYLFPYTKEALENFSFSRPDDSWVKEKRICSLKYFKRYFLYSVPSNDISDVYFDEFIDTIDQKDFNVVKQETNDILDQINPDEFITKIGFTLDRLNWEKCKVLTNLILINEKHFEGVKGGSFMFHFNPKSRAAITICDLMKSNNNYDERFRFIAETFKESQIDFEFFFELIRWIDTGRTDEEKTLKSEDISHLKNILLERALSKSNNEGSNIFEHFPNQTFKLLDIWHKKDAKELKKYIGNCLIKNKKFSEVIIDTLTSTIYSSSYPEPYKVDFKKETYDLLKKYYNIQEIYDSFQGEDYSKLRKTKPVFFDVDQGQNKQNAIRQFLYYYEKDHQGE